MFQPTRYVCVLLSLLPHSVRGSLFRFLRHRCLCCDLKSSLPLPKHTLRASIHAVRDALDSEDLHVLGHSQVLTLMSLSIGPVCLMSALAPLYCRRDVLCLPSVLSRGCDVPP